MKTINPSKARNHSETSIDVPAPQIFKKTAQSITIEGKSPLIVNSWSATSIADMMEKQTTAKGDKLKKKERAPVDPINRFHESIHWLPDGKPGFPVAALKACIVRAGSDEDFKMTDLRRWFHIQGDLLPIETEPLKSPVTQMDVDYATELKKYHAMGISMRRDMIKLQGMTASIAFRAQYPKWRIKATLIFSSNIDLTTLLYLIRSAGFGVGIGAWRPECKGQFGMFDLQ